MAILDPCAELLGSNGGSFGFSGPRGAGKSWLMLRAVSDARRDGLGLWYPSPSEYNSLAFLASLIDSLAGEIEKRYREAHPVREAIRANSLLGLGFIIVAAVAAFGVLIRAADLDPWWLFIGALGALAAALYATFMTRFPTALQQSTRSEQRLLREATIFRERARYTATRREAIELGAEAGRGFTARARSSRERELVERPATLSSLINDFRTLAEHAGEVAGRVVIAIDELDKMDDGERVRELLRDIKGIFEVPRVHFFVSVSDEAARSLNLGALSERNEFNSSFYTVIELPPVKIEACADLLERRAHVPRDVALALAILAAGNPREVLRLAEIVGSTTIGPVAVVKVLREEALSLRREIVTALNTTDGAPLSADARAGAFGQLPDEAFDNPAALLPLTSVALETDVWNPPWQDAGWDERFAEAWRRLLVRLAVARELIESPSIVQDLDRGELLQDVVLVAGQSAAVARIMLERRLRVDVREAAMTSTEARERLGDLGRRYEEVRGSMKPGSERTTAMEEVIGEARSIAREAAYDVKELTELSRSNDPGKRVVALAAIQATGDPETLPVVLEEVQAAHTPFEQYHALRALDSVRPALSEQQREEVRAALAIPDLQSSIGARTDRRRLLDRILQSFEAEATFKEATSSTASAGREPAAS
jgi:KAP family P-loop domain